MTAAVRRLQVSGHELKGDGGLAYGWDDRCGRPVPARCGPWTPPGMLAWERQRRTLRSASRPAAGRPG